MTGTIAAMKRIQDQIHTSSFREIGALRTVFACVANRPADQKLRILSFGCSIGEEIASLRYFFPDAEIVGCDAYAFAREVAQRSVGHLAEIIPSVREEILALAPFDIVMACSVLCLNPPTDFETRFPVELFDTTLWLLQKALVPGGLLVITNSSYRFQHSPVFKRFYAIRSDIISSSGFVDVFARDGRAFLNQLQLPAGRAYRRGPAFEIADDEEMTECVFRKRDEKSLLTSAPLRLAPPPPHFKELASYRRSNLDSMSAERGEGLIEVFSDIRFGFNADTGERGQIVTVGWQSLVHDGYHARLPVWEPMPW